MLRAAPKWPPARLKCDPRRLCAIRHPTSGSALTNDSIRCAGYERPGYSPECQSVLSAKCLMEHSSMSSEYPGGRNELSQSSPKRALTAFISRQTETNTKTSSSPETLLPKKCP